MGYNPNGKRMWDKKTISTGSIMSGKSVMLMYRLSLFLILFFYSCLEVKYNSISYYPLSLDREKAVVRLFFVEEEDKTVEFSIDLLMPSIRDDIRKPFGERFSLNKAWRYYRLNESVLLKDRQFLANTEYAFPIPVGPNTFYLYYKSNVEIEDKKMLEIVPNKKYAISLDKSRKLIKFESVE